MNTKSNNKLRIIINKSKEESSMSTKNKTERGFPASRHHLIAL